MTQLDAAGNLLYGVLARRHGLVDHQQFRSAIAALASDPSLSLREELRKAGSLPQSEEERLEEIFLKHVQSYGNDTQKGLGAALSTDIAALETIADLANLKSNGQQKSAGAAIQPDRPVAERRGVELAIRQTFRLGRDYWEGGMGVVFDASHDELNRRVAVKRIRPIRRSPAAEARFLREAEITASLEHPAILPIFSYGHDEDGHPCCAMRFARKGKELKNGDLLRALEDFHHDAIVDGELDYHVPRFRRLLGHLVAVCHAVELAHSREIIHRDIKPEHVWLGEFNQTILLDWGLAKQLRQPAHEDLPLQAAAEELAATIAPGDSETQIGATVGTPGYMSPEQAAGDQGRLGPASDIYCLGASLYQVLTGRRSQSDNWQEQTIRGILTPPRQLQPKIPGALEAICLKAMALRPEDRYTTAAGFRQDLENWLADEPVSVWPDPFIVRSQRWMRRHRTLTTSTAAAVLVAVAALSALNVQGKKALATQTALTAQRTEALKHESDALTQRTAALESEKIAKEQAETNFGLARTAVDDLFTKVSETKLLNHPGLQPLREDLLSRAKDYYLKFLEQAPAAEVALAHYRLGRVHQRLGNLNGALAEYEKARNLQDQLAKQEPTDAAALASLSTTINALGTLHDSPEKRDRALEYFTAAVALRERASHLDPANLEYQRLRANTVMNIGVMHMGQKTEEARTNLEAAQDLRRAADPRGEHPQIQRDLAKGLYSIANLTLNQVPADKIIEDDLQGAIAIFQRQKELRPTSDPGKIVDSAIDDDLQIARCHLLIAKAKAKQLDQVGRDKAPNAKELIDQGQKQVEKAGAILLPLARKAPSMPEIQHDLARAFIELGWFTEEPNWYNQAGTELQRLIEAGYDTSDVQDDLKRAQDEFWRLTQKRTNSPATPDKK